MRPWLLNCLTMIQIHLKQNNVNLNRPLNNKNVKNAKSLNLSKKRGILFIKNIICMLEIVLT